VATSRPVLAGQALPEATVTLFVDGIAVGTSTGAAFSLVAPALTEGAHRWTATQANNGATSSRATEEAFTVGTVAPTSRTHAPSPGTVFRASPMTLSGTASDATSGVARAELSGQGSAWQVAQGTTAWRWNFSPPSEGTWRIAVRAVDLAGDVEGAGPSATFAIDAISPETTWTDTPPANTPSASASFAFTANESGVGFECSMDGTTFLPCTFPWGVYGLSGGAHVAEVRSRDAAGNVDSTPARHAWRVDTEAPAAHWTSTPPALISSPSATFGFGSPDPEALFKCSLDGAACLPCSSPRVLGALHVDPTPARVEKRVDTQAPTVTIQSLPALTASPTAEFGFTASEPATFACALDGGPAFTCSPPVRLGGLSHGPHALSVRGVDAAGNGGPAAPLLWTVDLQPPELTITTASPAFSASPTAMVSFTVNEPAESGCSLDGRPFAPCTSPSTWTGLLEGAHVAELRAGDAAGNTGPPTRVTWTQDTVLPTVTVITAPPPLSPSTRAAVAFQTSEPATHTCSLDGAPAAPCTNPPLMEGLAPGAHLLLASAVDLAGNAGLPAVVRWTADATAPAAPELLPVSSTVNMPPIERSAEPGTRVTVFVDGQPVGEVEVAVWEVGAREPDTTILSGPLEVELVGEDPAFTFAATLPDASFECSLDAAPLQPCAGQWAFRSMPTASHALAVRAVSRAGVVDPTPTVRTWITDPDALPTRKIRVKGSSCGCGAADGAWPWWGLLAPALAAKKKRAVTRNRTTAP